MKQYLILMTTAILTHFFSKSILPSDTLFGIGTQQNVVLSAVDLYGNSSSCSFTITLIDTTAPQIFCPDT